MLIDEVRMVDIGLLVLVEWFGEIEVVFYGVGFVVDVLGWIDVVVNDWIL